MVRVLGLGLGLFILAFLWAICLAACLFLTRKQSIDGAYGPLLVGLFITVLLVFFPRDTGTDSKQVHEVIDYVFIPRMVLLSFVCLCFIAGLFLLIANQLAQPVYARTVVRKT